MKSKILCVLAIALLCVPSTSFADSITNNIQVTFNTIKLKVNGLDIKSDNILYNGRTYVQLRDVAEMLDKNITWYDSTKTAYISEKVPTISESSMKQNFIYSYEYKSLYDLAKDISEVKSTLYFDQVQISATNTNSKLASNQIDECIKKINDKVDYIKSVYANDIESSNFANILSLTIDGLSFYTKASSNLSDFYYSRNLKGETDFNLYSENILNGNDSIKKALDLANNKYLDYASKILK